jgi:competence protein ComFC
VSLPLIRTLGSWAKLVELVFFPSFCRLCGGLLDKPGERVVCTDCWGKAQPHQSSICPSCGRFYEGDGESRVCRKCIDRRPPFSVHRSSGRYDGILKDLVLLYKYRRLSVLGKGLADFAFQALGGDDELWWGVDGIVPVPLHPRKKRERGFNQARIFARELAKLSGLDLIDGALIKVRSSPPQTSLEADERAENVRGAYLVRRKEMVRGKILLLADDVYTTGSTLKECSRALLSVGAKEVRAITIAQA